MTNRDTRDLFALVADKDMEHALSGLLTRSKSIGMRPIDAEIKPHPQRDPGCRSGGAALLRTMHRQYDRALLMFDHEGSGRETIPAIELESQLEEELAVSGWGRRCAVIVLEPELEAWIWSGSTAVDAVCGWSGRIPALRTWLVDEGFLDDDAGKPRRPKEAFELALKNAGKGKSSALFKELAERVTLRGCRDRAFNKLLSTLRAWFPASPGTSAILKHP